MDTKNEQDAYLINLIAIEPVKQRRPRMDATDSSKPSRGASFSYHVSTSSGSTQVCKKGFIHMHGVTNDRVRRLCSLLVKGESPKDMRGKGISANAISDHVVKCVMEHISSFPNKTSHYSNKDYSYLSERLNLKIMHDLFIQTYPDLNVKYGFYRKIFQERFNLKFGRPQVDTCSACEELSIKVKNKVLNLKARQVAVAEKAIHLRRSKKFYNKMKDIEKKTQEDEEVCGIVIDFMQNVHLPVIPVQETFYLRQLNVSVFCIHNLKKESDVVFYVYHEGIAGKGPNDVCSMLKHYIDDYIPNNVKHLHVFSDGCSAQNRNNCIVRMFLALVDLKRFSTVNQYFPMRGHSFLPCDRDFSVIKRKLKRVDRIYTIREYVELICSSSAQGKFIVVAPDSSLMLDFKQWWPLFYKATCLSNESLKKEIPRENKVSFKVTTFRHYTYTCQHPGMLVAREFIDGLVDHTFSLRTGTLPLCLPKMKAYPSGCKHIQKKKLDDILKLEQYIPHEETIQQFYSVLFVWPTTETNMEGDA